ncbi:hypothetical protein EJB05_50834, partial [Eragrostis curvula]
MKAALRAVFCMTPLLSASITGTDAGVDEDQPRRCTRCPAGMSLFSLSLWFSPKNLDACVHGCFGLVLLLYKVRNRRIYHGASGKFFLVGVRSCFKILTQPITALGRRGFVQLTSTRARQVLSDQINTISMAKPGVAGSSIDLAHGIL